MTAGTNPAPTSQPNPSPSTLRAVLPWLEAVAGVALLVVAIAFLLALRRMHEDLSRANADLARMNATNAPSARLDR